jgi:hypothetical protein
MDDKKMKAKLRRQFLNGLKRWPHRCEAWAAFVLRHPGATPAEVSSAGSWLFVNGFRPEDY